ncbi:MAG: type II toxin-antitoxin system RelE family toxin [Halochromatium sp.]|uniref:type II toxin-antitoxin system RelE family toxin n=1 Tax=Halochromatium sp. TaxID=2049430 RepID=UPI00397D95E5
MTESPVYRVRFTRQAEKDVRKLSPKLRDTLKQILRNRIAVDPRSGKALVGPLKGYYSVRLSLQDRIVYSIHDEELIVLVLRARSHYGD